MRGASVLATQHCVNVKWARDGRSNELMSAGILFFTIFFFLVIVTLYIACTLEEHTWSGITFFFQWKLRYRLQSKSSYYTKTKKVRLTERILHCLPSPEASNVPVPHYNFFFFILKASYLSWRCSCSCRNVDAWHQNYSFNMEKARWPH